MNYTYHDTPVGRLLLAGDNTALRALYFESGGRAREPEATWSASRSPFSDVCRQLDEYFAGTRMRFELPLAPQVTAFRRRVLDALLTIPYGQTRSYGEIARQIGSPKASRAVGAANGANPIPIIIPCHRVIGSNGALTGFGGGLDTKQFLLRHEAAHSGLFADAR